jgi:hypothetical protein
MPVLLVYLIDIAESANEKQGLIGKSASDQLGILRFC